MNAGVMKNTTAARAAIWPAVRLLSSPKTDGINSTMDFHEEEESMFTIELDTKRVTLQELHPTQLTLGKRRVEQKRAELKELSEKKRQARMAAQLYPAVKGPGKRYYVLDHHHEAMAALSEGAKEVGVGVVCDLSHLSQQNFWVYMDHRSWIHCYDQHGERQTFDAVPKKFQDMADDSYRSLAASVEERGGFAKPDEPFFEFLWANHFRNHIAASLVKRRFDDATAQALKLARSSQSAFLPGWAGKK